MKNIINLTGILTLFLIIGLSVINCNTNSKTPPDVNLMFETPVPKDAADLTANISVGWNLGNTLDTHNGKTGFHWLGGGVYSKTSVSEMETAWGNPVTTKAMITKIRTSGFNTIRLPVSWGKAADSNFNIRADWIDRVKTIVDYAVDNDMYIILNTHHDEEYYKFTSAEAAASKTAFKKIWEQIAAVFKDYDEKLIFEALNEPRTIGSSAEWNGGTAEEHKILNEHYQIFVDTVRASGGNNDKRILMITTYAASATQTAINGLVLPVDTASNKLIVSVHAYEPYNFALNKNQGSVSTWSADNSSDTSGVRAPLDRVYAAFVSKGIPVIMGEFGAINKSNEAARAAWAEYYVSYAKSKGLACVWWDDGGDIRLLNRNSKEFYYPQIYNALIRGIKKQ